MKLNNETLSRIAIPKPGYDRNEIGVGIVHFGVGGFHRAHQAMYVDRLLDGGTTKDWAICGVGVLHGDRKMADVMAAAKLSAPTLGGARRSFRCRWNVETIAPIAPKPRSAQIELRCDVEGAAIGTVR